MLATHAPCSLPSAGALAAASHAETLARWITPTEATRTKVWGGRGRRRRRGWRGMEEKEGEDQGGEGGWKPRVNKGGSEVGLEGGCVGSATVVGQVLVHEEAPRLWEGGITGSGFLLCTCNRALWRPRTEKTARGAPLLTAHAASAARGSR